MAQIGTVYECGGTVLKPRHNNNCETIKQCFRHMEQITYMFILFTMSK